jgi:squalene-hopene/tetraprenyl-beta-curcumene cyclase
MPGIFQRIDRVLHRYSRRPVGLLRRAAMRKGVEWILARQEADGSWGGIQPPWVYSILALHLMGYPLEHPALAAGINGLEGFTIREETPDGVVRRLEACQSPVWDTGLAVTALLDAGVAADDEAILRATDWLLDEEIDVPGDWQVKRPDLAPGGWAFEFANDGYPDTDDTAEVVLALRRVRHPDMMRLAGAVKRGVQGRRLGCVRCRQHPRADLLAAIQRFRRGDRPAVRRCHCSCRRDARRRRPGAQPGVPTWRRLAARGAGG